MEKQRIQAAIDYIENHLSGEISASDLSELTGYSVFHLYRAFQDTVGMPVMQYILKRRLLNAIYEIGAGRKKIDAALDYGFDTYSGFYKSFVRELGYTPAEYLRKFRVKKPYRINLAQEAIIMPSHKRIAAALANWGLQDARISDVIFAESGEMSESAKYVGDKYVIKYSDSLETVMKAIRIYHALSDAGLAAPIIVPTADGGEYAECGGLYFFVTEKLRGDGIPASRFYLDECAEKARFIGEITGRLDLALQKIDAAVESADTFAAVRDRALPALKDLLHMDSDFAANYMREFERLYGLLPRQIIHRDPNPSNIIISGDQWGFIDFDLSERNARIFDPCYAATAILSETYGDGNATRLEKWISILREIMFGYDSVVQLSDEEKEAVPYMILANQLTATAWFAGKEKYRDLFGVNLKMTEWVIQNFERLAVFGG